MSGAGKRRPSAEDIPAVLLLICEGKSLRASCADLGLDPPSTHTFIDSDEGIRQQYARAREQRAEVLAEEALTYGRAAAAGKVKPDGARVAIDAIKWATARMAPKTHGDRQQIEHTGANGGPIQTVDLSKVSDDDLKRLEHVLGALAHPGAGGSPAGTDQDGTGEAEG